MVYFLLHAIIMKKEDYGMKEAFADMVNELISKVCYLDDKMERINKKIDTVNSTRLVLSKEIAKLEYENRLLSTESVNDLSIIARSTLTYIVLGLVLTDYKIDFAVVFVFCEFFLIKHKIEVVNCILKLFGDELSSMCTLSISLISIHFIINAFIWRAVVKANTSLNTMKAMFMFIVANLLFMAFELIVYGQKAGKINKRVQECEKNKEKIYIRHCNSMMQIYNGDKVINEIDVNVYNVLFDRNKILSVYTKDETEEKNLICKWRYEMVSRESENMCEITSIKVADKIITVNDLENYI